MKLTGRSFEELMLEKDCEKTTCSDNIIRSRMIRSSLKQIIRNK